MIKIKKQEELNFLMVRETNCKIRVVKSIAKVKMEEILPYFGEVRD